MALTPTLAVWRHPRPEGVAGLCIGAGSDPAVHWRRAKRLARRIQAHARRHRLSHEVVTSPLSRCADVGAWLARWGWRHRTDATLLELDFGSWEGRRWDDIGAAALEAWTDSFLHHRPGDGESLAALLTRCSIGPGAEALAVGHGGWMLARRWATEHPGEPPTAARWPSPPRYGECWRL